MWYASSSVILLSKLMSTTVRSLRVPSALVVHTTKYGYVNGLDLLHSTSCVLACGAYQILC